MMRINIVVIAMLILFSCCSMPPGFKHINSSFSHTNIQCESLIEQIDAKWVKSVNFICYYEDIKLLNKIQEQKECFIKLGINDLKKIFGNPTRSDVSTYYYNVSKECLEGDDLIGTSTLQFVLKDEIVMNLYYKGNPPPH